MPRILVADDHALMRRGMRDLLATHDGWQVCDEAANGREAVEMAIQQQPDLVVLDLSIPEWHETETKAIRKGYSFSTRQFSWRSSRSWRFLQQRPPSSLSYRPARPTGSQHPPAARVTLNFTICPAPTGKPRR